MFAHPNVSQLARERHRDMLAQADRQRPARKFHDAARASRRAESGTRPMTRSLLRGLQTSFTSSAR